MKLRQNQCSELIKEYRFFDLRGIRNYEIRIRLTGNLDYGCDSGDGGPRLIAASD